MILPSLLVYCFVRNIFYESSCLGMQLKVGGKFHRKLNTGARPIANKYREGKMKRTLKRELKSTWNCWKGIESYSVLFLYIFQVWLVELALYAKECQSEFYFMGNDSRGGILPFGRCYIFWISGHEGDWGMNNMLWSIWTLLFGTFDKMIRFVPSWNTDQGV